MRRDSEPALRVVRLAEDNGLAILGSRLETWDQEDMLWPEGTPDDHKVEYLRQLLRLTGHRKSRDRAALIMAVHGCPTARLRSALAAAFEPGPTDAVVSAPLNVDTTDPAVADGIADTVEAYTSAPLGTGTFKATTAKVLDSVAQERARWASERIGRDELDWEAVVRPGQRIKPDDPGVFRQRVGRRNSRCICQRRILRRPRCRRRLHEQCNRSRDARRSVADDACRDGPAHRDHAAR